ncbi:hypothetical protein ADU59_00610 (plasmid) [Pararhizobium polonicum]|uniref:HTH tetR-type domain-containing protein n=1 Tax=Pararhizobium polonicum TaxID=1612624 RepID=A0A1C7P8E3_9HYPH|nr:TetR/AcrR family transcriptional regulator [Pararhizobium polonicum]OBZ97549.1 hypothetical protein ADU59_00610 [Pararhizobium polonicum]
MTVKSARGRPRDPALREAIIEAAKEEFFSKGLAGASLARIAERASTTRVTIYSYFPSREDLFYAAVNAPVVNSIRIDPEILKGLPPREQLLRVAVAFMESIADPSAIAQIHALYEGSKKRSKISQSFYATGPQELIDVVAEILSVLVLEKVLRVPDIQIGAEQFLALVRGNEQMRALLSLAPGRTGRDRMEYIEASVDLFLRGYRIGDYSTS